jgi:hypothetical protein
VITIILEDKNSKELERVSEKDNSQYIIQQDSKYKYLSLIDDCSYDVFLSTEMQELIQDLTLLKSELNNLIHIDHVDKILGLAEKCKNTKDTFLIFTPWPDG